MCTTDRRVGLHTKLCSVLSSFGVWLWDPFNFDVDDVQQAIETEAARHVYFQPPDGVKLSYPCIIYKLDKIDTIYAGNLPYRHRDCYKVTCIDKDPESKIPQKIAELPMCVHDRRYEIDNLYHDVFTIYH